MAIMLPPNIPPDTESQAEKTIFRKFKEELPDSEWVVLHSLGLTIHDRKPWAEIDFVLIGPPGVFCLEVKGGTISREGRVWTTTTRAGRTSPLRESPFAQAGSAAAALHRFLRAAVPVIRSSVTGYGVMFPDVTFRVEGPDIDPALLFDARDVPLPARAFVERLADHWRARRGKGAVAAVSLLTVEQRRQIRDAIARDFNLVASLRIHVGQVNDQLIRLTEEQQRTFAGLAENSRVLIMGGAGTGKTLLGVYEAQRLAAAGLRVLVVCFNRCLAEYLRRETAGRPGITVEHLHGFMARIVQAAGLSGRLPDAEPRDLFDVFYPELCLEALLEKQPEAYDALIVDEGQDLLKEPYLDVMDAVLQGGLANGRWRAFLDPHQDIYGAIGERALARLFATNPARYRLSVNCRNTRPIAIAASLLSGISADEVLIADGPDVVRTWYHDREQERRLVSDAVRRLLYRGLPAHEVAILSPLRIENSCLADGLISSVAPVHMCESVGDRISNAVPFWTIASFKGLEADTVVLVDLDDLTRRESLLSVYVGASRPRVVLEVFVNETQREAYAMLARSFGERRVSDSAQRRSLERGI